jgi:hypothetical protein
VNDDAKQIFSLVRLFLWSWHHPHWI